MCMKRIEDSRVGAEQVLQGYVVRPGVSEDARALFEVMNMVMGESNAYLAERLSYTVESQQAFLQGQEPDRAILVAEVENTIVGWVSVVRNAAQFRSHTGMIIIGVVAEHRAKGLGHRLLQAAEQEARRMGMEKLELGVRADNKRAEALYARVGFQGEGRLRRGIKDNGHYVDEILMGKLLIDK